MSLIFSKIGHLKWQYLFKSEVMCGQVWWPILWICALHLTHPSAHTAVNTHLEQCNIDNVSASKTLDGTCKSENNFYHQWIRCQSSTRIPLNCVNSEFVCVIIFEKTNDCQLIHMPLFQVWTFSTRSTCSMAQSLNFAQKPAALLCLRGHGKIK